MQKIHCDITKVKKHIGNYEYIVAVVAVVPRPRLYLKE